MMVTQKEFRERLRSLQNRKPEKTKYHTLKRSDVVTCEVCGYSSNELTNQDECPSCIRSDKRQEKLSQIGIE